MAQTVTLTPQDYTSILAMLNHEGANGITALLNNGSSADALGYTGGLIDVWTNRAAASGRAPWQEMNRPSQITDWDPSQIQAKANSLDPRIKELADAYLSQRSNGGQAIAPNAGFYLNTQLVQATPSYGTKYEDWYKPGTVEAAFGDTRSGGRNSLQTEFVANPDEYDVPQYSLALDRSLNLAPTSNGASAYNQLMYRSNPISTDPSHPFNAGFGGYLNADPTTSIGGAPAQTSTAQGPNFGSLYGIQPNPVVTPTDFLKGYDVSGDTGAQTFSSLYGPDQLINAAYHNYLGRNATAEEKGAWDDKIGQPGTVLSDLVGQIASSPEANAVRAKLNLGPYDFSGAQVGTNGGPGSIQGAQPSDSGVSYNPFQSTDLNAGGGGPQPLVDLGTLLGGTDFSKANVGTNGGASGIQATPVQDAGLNLGPMRAGPLNTGTSNTGALQTLILGNEAGQNGFSAGAYLDANPDVAGVAQSQHLDPMSYALTHYLQFGAAEGRKLSADGTATFNPAAFDVSAYLRANPDVRAAAQASGQDPATFAIDHFIQYGGREGRQALNVQADGGAGASAAFNPYAYLQQNPDVLQVAEQQHLDPTKYALQHFLTNGIAEGRSEGAGNTLPFDHFDAQAYLAKNPDVAASGMNPLYHFLEYGAEEGRNASFDASNPYSFSNADVSGGYGGLSSQMLQALGIDQSGIKFDPISGGAIGTPTINTSPLPPVDTGNPFSSPTLNSVSPIGDASTVDPGVGPYAFGHTNVSQGVGNGSVSDFDPSWYLANNPDVAQVAQQQGVDPSKYALQHYLTFGYNEGRAVAPNEWLTGGFDANGYYAANPDVKAAGVDALTHYLTDGLGEGRSTGGDTSPFSFSGANVSGGVGNGSLGLPSGYAATGTPNGAQAAYGYSGPILSPSEVQARSAATQQYMTGTANLNNFFSNLSAVQGLQAGNLATINSNPNYVAAATPVLSVASDGAGAAQNNLATQQFKQGIATAQMSQAQPAVQPLVPVSRYGQQTTASGFPSLGPAFAWMG